MSFDKEKFINDLNSEFKICELVKFDEFDIVEKLQNNPYQLMKFQDLVIKEKAKYDEFVILQEKLIGELYHKYRFEYDEELTPKEIEKYYIPKDPKFLKMDELLRKQKIKIAFFEICVKGLDRQYWSMKEFTNARKGV